MQKVVEPDFFNALSDSSRLRFAEHVQTWIGFV